MTDGLYPASASCRVVSFRQLPTVNMICSHTVYCAYLCTYIVCTDYKPSHQFSIEHPLATRHLCSHGSHIVSTSLVHGSTLNLPPRPSGPPTTARPDQPVGLLLAYVLYIAVSPSSSPSRMLPSGRKLWLTSLVITSPWLRLLCVLLPRMHSIYATFPEGEPREYVYSIFHISRIQKTSYRQNSANTQPYRIPLVYCMYGVSTWSTCPVAHTSTITPDPLRHAMGVRSAGPCVSPLGKTRSSRLRKVDLRELAVGSPTRSGPSTHRAKLNDLKADLDPETVLVPGSISSEPSALVFVTYSSFTALSTAHPLLHNACLHLQALPPPGNLNTASTSLRVSLSLV